MSLHLSAWARDWGGTAFVVLLVAGPPASLILLRQAPQARADVVTASELISYTILLGAAVFMYFHWRTVGGGLAAWLGVGLILAAVDGLLQSGLVAGSRAAEANGWSQLSHIGLCISLAFIAWAAERTDVWKAAGMTVALTALGLVVGLSLLTVSAQPLALTRGEDLILDSLVFISGLVVVAILLQLPCIGLWVRQRLACAGLALVIGIHVQHHASGSVGVSIIAVTAYAVAAVMIFTTALRLFRGSTLEHAHRLSEVHTELEEVRAVALFERERLHEINSTIAGIANATRILRHDQGLPQQSRERLEEMLENEAARLERLIGARSTPLHQPFDIDETIAQLVVSHRARGHLVNWSPNGQRAVGRADDIAEVVNILMANAAEHGRGAVASLEVRTDGDVLLITCSDGGPGVSPEVRDRLFESGVRGPDSAGQGLGLAIAQRLVTQHGGTLELCDSGGGAVFVARFPQTAVSHGALDHASQ